MKAAGDAPLLAATDLAEWLVREGMPFREAHAVVGQVVQRVVAGEGSLADLVAAHPSFGPRAAEVIGVGRGVRRRTTPGGAGPEPVAVQYDAYCSQMKSLRTLLDI